MKAKLPPSLEKLIDELAAESQRRVNEWLEQHQHELAAIDVDSICVAQLHYMTMRDAGMLDPDPRKFHCPSCRRTAQLEMAALKLWLFSIAARSPAPVVNIRNEVI